ncbi:MAG: DUF3299 domain-containing protein [Porticoccaceae bacterium]
MAVSIQLKHKIALLIIMMSMFISQVIAQGGDTERGKNQYKTVEWTDLIPQNELDILLNPPDYMDDIQDGSFEDQIDSQLRNTTALATEDRYQQALVSTNIRPEMDGKAIRIPGFIVPLEFNSEQTITEFFLVPYFGACLHMPPPAPNQIIYVKHPEGIQLNALYDPFWITGVLRASLVENDLAAAAYVVEMADYEPYTQ